MRWKYIVDEHPSEAVERALTRQKIADWWQAFTERTNDLDALFSQRKKWDLPQWMNQNLNSISEHLMWEFGPGLLGGHRLVITPEAHHELRPLVSAILDAAPRIANWEFYPYRLPEPFEEARRSVEARGGTLLSEMRFVLRPGAFNRVDVRCLVQPAFPQNLVRPTAFVAMESLLGEEILDHWIGYIESETAEEIPSDAVDAAQVLTRLRAVIGQIVGTLPPKPWMGRMSNRQWSLINLEPKRMTDYAGREDQLTQISPWPDLHQAMLTSGTFFSRRFSRCEEIFAYVKIDGAEGLPGPKFKDRGDIENSLLQSLESAGVGTVIGGGHGLRYSYADLALIDVTKAIPIIRDTLSRGGVSKRSWLLFSDQDDTAEWVGIHPDSPCPPAETT